MILKGADKFECILKGDENPRASRKQTQRKLLTCAQHGTVLARFLDHAPCTDTPTPSRRYRPRRAWQTVGLFVTYMQSRTFAFFVYWSPTVQIEPWVEVAQRCSKRNAVQERTSRAASWVYTPPASRQVTTPRWAVQLLSGQTLQMMERQPPCRCRDNCYKLATDDTVRGVLTRCTSHSKAAYTRSIGLGARTRSTGRPRASASVHPAATMWSCPRAPSCFL